MQGTFGGGLKLGAVTAAANGVTSALNAVNDASKSTSQKMRGLIDAIPGGKIFTGLADAITGTSARIAATQRNLALQLAINDIDTKRNLAVSDTKLDLQKARANAIGFAQLPAQRSNLPNTTNARALAEAGRVNAAEAVDRQAQRSVIGNRALQTDLQGELKRIAENTSALRSSRQGFSERSREVFAGRGPLGGAFGEREKRANALSNEENSIDKLQGGVTEQLAKARQLQQAIVAGVQAEADKRQGMRGIIEANLQNLKQREQIARGTARSFGSLTRGQRAQATQIAQRAKAQGFENLAPQELALLQRAGGGQFVGRGLEQRARKDDNFAAFNRAIGQRSLDDAVKDRVEVQNNLNFQVNLDEKAIADALANKLGPIVDSITKLQNEAARLDRERKTLENRLNLVNR